MKQVHYFRWCVIGLFVLLALTYSNHFGNSFHFDDTHCIGNNAYIRDLKNIPLFFKTAATFSSLPLNQTYRPMLSTLYAIDYKLGGGNVFPFHVFIFLFYVLQGILMYLVVLNIFNKAALHTLNNYFALFATGWYMLNTANAETINYISASSDSISTFWVMFALATYIYLPVWKKYFLYLIPIAIGVLFKPTALVFPGLLAVYIFLLEKKDGRIFQKIGRSLFVSLPSLLMCIALYVVQAKLTSPSYVNGGNMFHYLITQPFVILHYFVTFFFPVGLSADNDWVALATIGNYRFWVGMAFLLALVFTVITLCKKPAYIPIVFGIAWFLIALLPATLVPLAEVMNDHRTFFPYVGLAIAAGWSFRLVWGKIETQKTNKIKPLATFMALILLVNAIGTYARNNVWHTEESLWRDVSVKSPNNGRGLMNYGLTLMAKGDYEGAESYYQKALSLLPTYSYLYENMAILKAAEKKYDEAEKYYKQALAYGYNIPVIYYYYAKFLHEQNRNNEAEPLVKQAIELSPADVYSRYLLMQLYEEQENWQALAIQARQTLAILPGDEIAQTYLKNSVGKKSKLEQAVDLATQHPSPDNYLNLSLIYYNNGEYDKCIEACQQAIKLNPNYYLAYNNIGSAYNITGDWQKAQQAFTKALKLKPDFELAKNNFYVALKQEKITDSMNAVIIKYPTPENYLNQSLIYYNQKLYLKSAEACKNAVKLNPKFALAYNNMCAAYNNLKMWNEAIAAGEKAVQLDHANQLAENNLAAARQGKARNEK